MVILGLRPGYSTFWFVVISSFCSAQSHRTVALTGQMADDGLGGVATYGQFGTVTLNNDGEVAFLAQLVPAVGSPIGAIWSEGDSNGAKLVAADGRSAPGVTNGVFTNVLSTLPFINDVGQVLFRTHLVVGSGNVTSSNDSGVWIANPGESPTLVLREGEVVPEGGATFGDQTSVFDRNFGKFNNAGQATVHHLLTGVPSTRDFGIWQTGIGQPTELVAREGSPAAGFDPVRFYSGLPASPTMNDMGTIAFYGSVTTFPGQAATDEVI